MREPSLPPRWIRGPRWLCGGAACLFFCLIASTKQHPTAACSAASAVLHHIAFPTSPVALYADMACNTASFLVFMPRLPAWCAATVLAAAANFFLHRHKRHTELEHILQVTVPCCCMAMMATDS